MAWQTFRKNWPDPLDRSLCSFSRAMVPLIPVVGVEDDRSDIGSVLVEWKWDMMVRSTFVCSNKACAIGDPRFSASAISIGSRGSSSSKVCSGLNGVAGAIEGRAIGGGPNIPVRRDRFIQGSPETIDETGMAALLAPIALKPG